VAVGCVERSAITRRSHASGEKANFRTGHRAQFLERVGPFVWVPKNQVFQLPLR